MRCLSLIVLLIATGLASTAIAQSYPTGPIRLIAPSPPGSPRDIRARWVAERLGPPLGQPVIVENRAGAGGNIGMEVAAKSPPDGHTLVMVDLGTMAQNPHLYPRTGYDALADFVPVTRLADGMLMLAVHPDVPARSLQELIALARAQPGRLSYGSSGVGTPPHLAGELFKRAAGIDVAHVPYKGASPAHIDLLGGRIAYTIDSLAVQMPAVRAGRLRPLAVTGLKRADVALEVPTFRDAGVAGYDYNSWMGVAAPAGTPPSIVSRLNRELVRALRQPEARAWFRDQGAEVIGDSSEEFANIVRSEYARWSRIIREAGITAD